MKKIFKAMAITVASAAMCVGVALSTGCTGGSGTYVGEYHYIGKHSDVPYGMVVEVTVENNIITAVKDITNTDDERAKAKQTYKDVRDGKEADEATYHTFTTVSPGWETYFDSNVNASYVWILDYGSKLGYEGEDAGALYYADIDEDGNRTGTYTKYDGKTRPSPIQTNVYSYGWTDANNSNWSSHESWLLQQYVGWSVADVLALDVYTDYGYKLVTGGRDLDMNSKGEPYGTDYNADLKGSELLISGATQGSGRLLLAVQNALGK